MVLILRKALILQFILKIDFTKVFNIPIGNDS